MKCRSIGTAVAGFAALLVTSFAAQSADIMRKAPIYRPAPAYSWTGFYVGAVAGYGAAALVVVQMLSLINKASTLINTAGTVILGLFGTGMDLAYQGAIAELTAKSLPSVPYSYPGA